MAVSIIPTREPAALVTQDRGPIAQALAPFHAQIAAMLPPDVPVARIVQELNVMAIKTPALVKAFEQNAARGVAAISEAVQTGLILGRTVFIVPFWSKRLSDYEWTVMAGYQGLIELMAAAGLPVDAATVWDCDDFRYSLGSKPFVDHTPGPESKRRAIIGAYAVGHRRHGLPPLVKFLTREEVEARRKLSKSWGPKDYPKLEALPWYPAKSAVRCIANFAPKNPRLAALLAYEARDDAPDATLGGATTSIADDFAGAEAVEQRVDPESGEVFDDVPTDDSTDLQLAQDLDVRIKGRTLRETRNSGLTRIIEWARETMASGGESERLQRLIAICQRVLEARAAGRTLEPSKVV